MLTQDTADHFRWVAGVLQAAFPHLSLVLVIAPASSLDKPLTVTSTTPLRTLTVLSAAARDGLEALHGEAAKRAEAYAAQANQPNQPNQVTDEVEKGEPVPLAADAAQA